MFTSSSSSVVEASQYSQREHVERFYFMWKCKENVDFFGKFERNLSSSPCVYGEDMYTRNKMRKYVSKKFFVSRISLVFFSHPDSAPKSEILFFRSFLLLLCLNKLSHPPIFTPTEHSIQCSPTFFPLFFGSFHALVAVSCCR